MLLIVDEESGLTADLTRVDCKTVRIFAYSIKYARAVKQKVWNEAENSVKKREKACEARALRAQDSYATLYPFLY